MNKEHYQQVNAFIKELMQKVRKAPEGLFDYPSLTTTSGIFYSSCIFTWDCHHMTLRYAMDGEAEIMKHFFLTILKFQRSDGFVPCTCNSVDGGCSSDFHAQPFLAQNAAVYLNLTDDTQTVETVFSKLEKYLNYWLNVSAGPKGLFRWKETWMSGFDNEIAGTICPQETILPPDLPSLLYLECRAMGFIARRLGEDDSFFEKRAAEIKTAVNKYLWDENMEIYSAYNILEDRIMTSLDGKNPDNTVGKYAFVSCPALMTLFSGVAEAERAEKMIKKYVLAPEHFRSPWGMRSLSKSSEYYNNARWGNPPRFGDHRRMTNSNWQGPVWIPINWFTLHGLLRYGFADEARKLADDTVELICNSVKSFGFMRENFHAETGEPLYADNFASWNILADKFHSYCDGRGMNIFPWE